MKLKRDMTEARIPRKNAATYTAQRVSKNHIRLQDFNSPQRLIPICLTVQTPIVNQDKQANATEQAVGPSNIIEALSVAMPRNGFELCWMKKAVGTI
jgi:hypothetical protein